MTAKEEALDAIKRLPPKVSFRRIAHDIELLAAIREADEDIQQGRVYSIEEVRKMIPQWISRSSSRKARRRT